MHLFLNEEQKEIQELARQIAQEKVIPVRAEYDEKEIFPWDVIKVLASSDMFGLYIPEEYGGMGMGVTELCLVVEELSKACGSIAVSYAASALGAFPILLSGTEEQKKKYLPDIAAGKKLAAFGLTEAGAGSDAGSIKTTATKDGDFYILNGTKQWITNAGEAEIYSVFAMTDKNKGARGASGFIVEKGTPGFTFGKLEDKLGIRSSATRELIFDNCKVPAENLLGGREGIGFIAAMKTFDTSRPGIAAQAVGIAQGAFDEALKYTDERSQFGKKIHEFQAIQHMLADMATKIEAARQLTYLSSDLVDKKFKGADKYSSMAKVYASDTAMEVTTNAVQILGGYGYMKEYPVEKYMRDAKITQIYEGTNQIQRNVIANRLIRENAMKHNK